MWICDACQEINDDSVIDCARCRRPFRSNDVNPVAMGQGEINDVPAFGRGHCVRNQTRPVPVYLISALIFVLNFVPILVHGVTFAVVGLGISSCACLLVATYYLWRDAEMMIHGVKTQGIVLSIDYVPEGGRVERGVYFTNVNFMVDGKSYSVRSAYGTAFQRYEVGGTATVWYDPENPALAVLGPRLAYQHLVPLAAGAVLCFFAYNIDLAYALFDVHRTFKVH